jgi:hypothetical protein
MRDARNRLELIALISVITVIVMAYPLFWAPSVNFGRPLLPTQRGHILRLPPTGPLATVLGTRSWIKLAIAAAADPLPKPDVGRIAGAVPVLSEPLAANAHVVSNVEVRDVTCDEEDRRRCFALVVVPASESLRLMQARGVWVWIER